MITGKLIKFEVLDRNGNVLANLTDAIKEGGFWYPPNSKLIKQRTPRREKRRERKRRHKLGGHR